jgi:adenylylsulfate kinase-like enzyme
VHGVTGLDDPYEPPLDPEIECRTDRETPAESVAIVMRAIQERLASRNAVPVR